MKLFSVYEIMKWDGGDRHYPSGFGFTNEQDAKTYQEKNSYDSFKKTEILVFDNFDEYDVNNIRSIKQAALAKLTDVERKLLGI